MDSTFKNTLCLCALVALLLSGCKKDKELPFTKLSPSKTNISFVNQIEDTDELNILDYLYFYNGGGVSVGDINGDDLPEIFFVSNLGENKLYLNKGNLKFEDITQSAGVEGAATWQTGTAMVDVNADGLLDIYVCAVTGIHGFTGKNELYINNGDRTFTEAAAAYGLDAQTYATAISFFDYDKDGDLDAYLLNHAVHTQDSYQPVEEARAKQNPKTGDILYRNDNGKYVNVTAEAGIYNSTIGYGLALRAGDFNSDGWVDLYVSNDFHEDDYYYINQHDGTFKESLKDDFSHTSRFSMGSDAADFNNDGQLDLFVADMLPFDENVSKTSVSDDTKEIYDFKKSFGYTDQYSRNVLQMNTGNGFSEQALLKGVAATDWSWGPLAQDFNGDGLTDLFISTGILRRPNDLDYIRYISSTEIQSRLQFSNDLDEEAIAKMPDGLVPNFLFLQNQEGGFDKIELDKKPNSSTGAAYADLDNDGDMDIVTNNVNSEAGIYINNTKEQFVKIKLKGADKNSYAIGAEVINNVDSQNQMIQNFPFKGFMSSSTNEISFLKSQGNVMIHWPRGGMNEISLHPDSLTIEFEEIYSSTIDEREVPWSISWFPALNTKFNLAHIENDFNDFSREKLFPYQLSKLGPAIAVSDFNKDGNDDFFFGNALHTKSVVGFGTGNDFEYQSIVGSEFTEDVAATTIDINGDGTDEILVLSGGSDVANNLVNQKYRFLEFSQGNFKELDIELPLQKNNEYATVKAADYDKDGDDDLFIGARFNNRNLGDKTTSFILENNNGQFTIVQEIEGLNTDATWVDINEDGQLDLITVAEWGTMQIYLQRDGTFEMQDITSPTGMWQMVTTQDIDKDGDQDIMLGNWGLNNKFTASEKYPIRLFTTDIDENGSVDYILDCAKNGKYYPMESIDALATQVVLLRKTFTNYKDLAGKTTAQIFGKDVLNKSKKLEAQELRSGYMRNDDGVFVFVPFDNQWQMSPITASHSHGQSSMLFGGLDIFKPVFGKMPGLQAISLNDGVDNMEFSPVLPNANNHVVTDIVPLQTEKNEIVMFITNNGPVSFRKMDSSTE